MRILGAEHGDNGDDGYNGGDGKMRGWEENFIKNNKIFGMLVLRGLTL